MPLLQIDNVLVTTEILTAYFCCNLEVCKGICCVEGDAGAPVTQAEADNIKNALPEMHDKLTPAAQQVIQKQGVAYIDQEGDLVTSIVNGKDCVFTCHEGGCCLCTIEKYAQQLKKPISCALYPIREVQLNNGTVGLQYHQWNICREAVECGKKNNIRLYQFLRNPLIRRFSESWYQQLSTAAEEYNKQEEQRTKN